MSKDTVGIVTPETFRDVVPDSYFGIAQLWYPNRAPMATRFPKMPIGQDIFHMVGYQFRPSTAALSATITNSATSLSVVDGSYIQVGDVLLLSTNEAVEVTAVSDNTLTVRRGIGTDNNGFTHTAGTAIADITTDPTDADIKIIGNSRTGAEVNQEGFSRIPSSQTQYVQTLQHVAQVGGKTQAMAAAMPLPPGTATPFAKYKMDAMQNFMDDMEKSALFGVGEAPTAGNHRGKMYGVTNLIQTNKTTSPTNASSYKPTDFQRDTVEAILKSGGRSSVAMVNTKFIGGLSTWGQNAMRLSAGSTLFGTPIDVYQTPLLPDVTIIYNMWLDLFYSTGTALVFTSEEVRWRVLREMDWKPYGRRGDAEEGDWIGDYAIELDNEAHHALVTGITGFAPAT